MQIGADGGLSVQEVAVPQPGKGEVLIRVRAAGVNPADWKFAGNRVGRIAGTDVSGVIDTLGEGVTGWKPGDEVLGFAGQSGSYAEYAIVPVNALGRKPKSLTFDQAAGMPVAAETAYRSLHEAAKLQSGQTVLIHGAAGGVGSAAVQIAKAAGAHVIGTASADNLAFIKSIGADQGVDYRAQKFEDAVQKVDVVLNTVNTETTTRSLDVVREGGALVSIVDAPAEAACVTARIRCASPDRAKGAPIADYLARTGDLVDAGKLTVVIENVYPMAEAAKAWENSRDGHARGKLIIRVSEGPTN